MIVLFIILGIFGWFILGTLGYVIYQSFGDVIAWCEIPRYEGGVNDFN